VKWLTTTDPLLIGQRYLITSFGFFLIGGVMALRIRAELAEPGLQIVDEAVYNQLFTMHGTIMLLLCATAAVRRLRECDHAGPDRRPGRGVPAAQHVSATGCSCSAV
jgi:hypothetical protein